MCNGGCDGGASPGRLCVVENGRPAFSRTSHAVAADRAARGHYRATVTVMAHGTAGARVCAGKAGAVAVRAVGARHSGGRAFFAVGALGTVARALGAVEAERVAEEPEVVLVSTSDAADCSG